MAPKRQITTAAATDGAKVKKKKDPNAPKGALSAFMYYSADQRPSVKAEQPDLKMGEIAKIIGARWKEISAEDKSKFEDMAAQDKKRAQTEKEAYKAKQAEEADATMEEAEAEAVPRTSTVLPSTAAELDQPRWENRLEPEADDDDGQPPGPADLAFMWNQLSKGASTVCASDIKALANALKVELTDGACEEMAPSPLTNADFRNVVATSTWTMPQ